MAGSEGARSGVARARMARPGRSGVNPQRGGTLKELWEAGDEGSGKRANTSDRVSSFAGRVGPRANTGARAYSLAELGLGSSASGAGENWAARASSLRVTGTRA